MVRCQRLAIALTAALLSAQVLVPASSAFCQAPEKAADSQPADRPSADDPPQARTRALLEKLKGQNAGPERFHDPWLRSLKEIVDLSNDAVPALIAELDSTDDDMLERSCGFTLRAIGDKRAVAALIRAIPRTLRPPGSDMGLQAEDADLGKWAQLHDLEGRDREGNERRYGFGRPVREICGAIEKLTGHTEGEEDLYNVFLDGLASQRRMKRELFHRVAQRWANWWEGHATDFDVAAADARVNLPPLEPSPDDVPADDAHFKTAGGGGSGWILESVYKPGARRVFYDLDTGRAAGLPERWSTAEQIEPAIDEIVAWAFREGFDLMGTEYKTDGGGRYYALQGIALKAWELAPKRWKMQSDDFTIEELQAEGIPAGSMLLHQDAETEEIDPTAKAPFLFITRHGTPGLLFVGIPVTDDSLKPGGIARGDHELDSVAFYKGRRFGFAALEEVR